LSFSETIQGGKFKVTTQFDKPLVCGEKGSFTVYLENTSDKPVQNLVLREKTFKLTTIPFDLAPSETCKIVFDVDVSNDFEYSPPLQFEFLKVLPPFPWEFYDGAAHPEFPDRIYEPAKTTIASVFQVYRKAQTIIPAKVKLGKKTFENKTKHDLTGFGFPEPRKTSETGGAMVFRLENRDFAVVQAYVAPSKSDDNRQILFWLVPCKVEQIAKNKRVASVNFDEGGSVQMWAWPFTKDKANDFQLMMNFLSQKYADKWLLYVKFDGKGGYNFENWMLIQ
jgi:hypothetical protein